MEKPRHYCCSDIKTVSEWIPVANGIDLALITRFERIYNSHHRDTFLKRVFTENEIKELSRFNHGKIAERIAARFAAKEACSKALGTGISQFGSRSAQGVHWKDIEVLHKETGEPYLRLYKRAKEKAQERGIQSFIVSLTHDGDYAAAFVVAIRPFS